MEHPDNRPAEETAAALTTEDDHHTDEELEGSDVPTPQKPRQLPEDLPRSLDDRKQTRYNSGVEFYDAWQGEAKYIDTPITLSRPLDLKLDSDSLADDGDLSLGSPHQRAPPRGLQPAEHQIDRMLAVQASYQDDAASSANNGMDETQIAASKDLPDAEKCQLLQKALQMAASNGDLERLKRLLKEPAKSYIDIDGLDEEGTAPLIYSSCFGHVEVVRALLEAGSDVNKQDRHKWSALMWATANRHKDIVTLLLDYGAAADAKTESGRTAFDFISPDSDLSDYLHQNGYSIGNAGVTDDFYNSGLSQDRFEEEMAENEMKRRMMMESAINLEVDLGNLGLDEQPETPEEIEEGQEFVWERCLNDQMFVFQESDLDRILDIIITTMVPVRSPSQKPVPANIIFLSARYAHYHANQDLLAALLVRAATKINVVVERNAGDMTMLAYWLSNCTLLTYYLKKDPGLRDATGNFQVQLAELINDIFVLIVRDAERRMDKVLDTAMLNHETIPGFEDVHFQDEWKIFRSKSRAKPEPMEKRFRPPSPKQRMKVSPRNISSLLSSTLFVLDLYDIHSVITAQVMGQLFYWLGAELFNRTISNRKYLARTKAMQVRMNVSTLEEWARNNNRQPEHYEPGSMEASGETTIDSARQHLAPIIQLLQWLQIFSSIGENDETLESTINQMNRLSPQQLIHAVKYYRAEVGETGLTKAALKRLQDLQKSFTERKAKRKSMNAPPPSSSSGDGKPPTSPTAAPEADMQLDGIPESLLLDPAHMLPFNMPSTTDMLVSYGAGFGGLDRERERKYMPTVPPEFLARFEDPGARRNNLYENENFDDE